MGKTMLGPKPLINPMPVLLVGAMVDGKPDFMTAAWAGVACSEPPMVSIAIRHSRYVLKGILDNRTFSVNLPSISLAKETDYCGMVSGSKTDKVKACGFKVFFGKTDSIPLIEQCPVNLECKLIHTLDLGSHLLVIGKIEETHISDECLVDGKPSLDKIQPLVYAMDQSSNYHAIGKAVGKAFSIGKDIDAGG
jgi:flavin reductase (DIM6/NTAB) family NADH-FMN oxidoreductase RutF